ncbi:Hpt domain-containing protein [Arthrobacter sp. D3-16]
MTPSVDAGRPLVDRTVLDRLREELGEDEGYCRIFVGNFIDYLPDRVGRLRLALTTGDLDASVDAVLSLKTSSQMVGAARLAGLATALEGEIRSGGPDADAAVVLPKLAASFLRRISQCSRQTMNRLRDQASPGASR